MRWRFRGERSDSVESQLQRVPQRIHDVTYR